MADNRGLPVAGPQCGQSKIHGPSDCILSAKNSVTSYAMNKKKHKTVLGDFKGVRVHEGREVSVVPLNFVGSHFIT